MRFVPVSPPVPTKIGELKKTSDGRVVSIFIDPTTGEEYKYVSYTEHAEDEYCFYISAVFPDGSEKTIRVNDSCDFFGAWIDGKLYLALLYFNGDVEIRFGADFNLCERKYDIDDASVNRIRGLNPSLSFFMGVKSGLPLVLPVHAVNEDF